MPLYRRKPTTIEVEQYNGDPVKGVCTFFGCRNDPPHVHTIHNGQSVNLVEGDWIMPEADGTHFYPCKDVVFKDTYEKVEP